MTSLKLSAPKIMKTLGAFTLACLMIPSVYAQSPTALGAGSSGGGFRNFQVREWIRQAKANLLPRVEASSSSTLARGNARSVVLDALSHIEILPSETRFRDGEELILDFDLARGRIQILKGFFEIFTPSMNSEDAQQKIRTLLLHEAGHLIGYADDSSAEEFAIDIQRWSYFVLSEKIEDICNNLTKIATSFDPIKVQTCYSSIQEKFCTNGNLKAIEADLLFKMSTSLSDCRVDLSEFHSEVAKYRAFQAYHIVSDFGQRLIASRALGR